MDWFKQKFELARGGDSDNLRPMEGLRGFAVFLVFLVHYVTLIDPWLENSSALYRFAQGLHTIGNAGVDLFFVLSGYLIYNSLISRSRPFWPYMGRRVQRIYPAFLAVLILYIALSFAIPTQSKIPPGFFTGLIYLIQNVLLLPGLFPIEPVITVAWSLSYEMFYYLAIPLLISMFGLRRWTGPQRILFFLGLALLFFSYCASYGGPVRLTMFISGIVIYEMMRYGLWKSPSSKLAFLFLLGGLSTLLIPSEGTAGFSLKIVALFVSFFVLCWNCFAQPKAGLGQAFSWTGLRWLGNMSYSYYLIHGLALKAGFMLLAKLIPAVSFGDLFFWLLLPPMFLLTLLPSTALFVLIERPFSLDPATRRSHKTIPAPASSTT